MTGNPEQQQPMHQGQAPSPPPAPGMSYPPPGGSSPSTWTMWQEAQVNALKGSIKYLILGLVMFLLAMGFIAFAAVANNWDQFKGLFGM